MRTGNLCVFPTTRRLPTVETSARPPEKRRRVTLERDTSEQSSPGSSEAHTLGDTNGTSLVTQTCEADGKSSGEIQIQDAGPSIAQNAVGDTHTGFYPQSQPDQTTIQPQKNVLDMYYGLQRSSNWLIQESGGPGDVQQSPSLPDFAAGFSWSPTDGDLFPELSNSETFGMSLPSPGFPNLLSAMNGSDSSETSRQSSNSHHIDHSIGELDDEEMETNVTLMVNASVARALIQTYFEKIHAFVPIINRPKYQSRLPELLGIADDKPTLPIEDALVIYGMMALSARFSNLPIFSAIPRKKRGRLFARQSGLLINRLLMYAEMDTPSLTFLHGSLLAAFFWLACAPGGKAWFLAGNCVRAAYSLSLNTIDEDLRGSKTQSLPAIEWVRREELRRAWWAAVECDNFASVIRCRPLTIDRGRMHVLLPSTDESWYSETPRTSAFLDDDVLSSWKQLKASTNLNPHAWYLVANQLMICSHEMSLKGKGCSMEMRDLGDVIHCFAMSIPAQFHVSSDTLLFEEESVGHDNWIIAMHIMLQGAFTYVMDASNENSASEPTRESPSEAHPNNSRRPVSASGTINLSYAPRYRRTLNPVLRAIRIWRPEYCITIQPFQVCAFLGPYGAYLQATFAAPTPARGELEREMIRETVARISEYWDVGTATLDVMDILTERFSSNSTLTDSDDHFLLKCLMPRQSTPPHTTVS
ncbi:hypothetical protein NA57DRAFT_74739 [Rhizodiscina lignyota]|uniref:Xylanolytic transcriptional activator regulatory domain-containing protein n=1 Tax=Rhizodiscina lignyota TaxID=1504668 RepID=A0A9P4IKX1_9PEZI|nr:hypothetical protein NA57DRAFT_74739 [Rhizodiscina lignyota]